MYVHLMRDLSLTETLLAKPATEKVMAQAGQTVKHYHSNNDVICTWPNMIDEIFWPFAIKAAAERLNSLQVDITGQTPESILHVVEIEDIPVKSYHTIFCPNYVLDARLHSSVGAGPPKWEPRSRIGVY